MDYSQPFSVLNEKLKPRFAASEQLNSSLERLEDRELGSLEIKSSSYQARSLPAELEPKVPVTIAESEDPEEAEDDAAQEDLVSDGLEEANCADPLPVINSCLITELNFKNVSEEELVEEDSSTSQSAQSEESDSPGELASEETKDSSESVALAGEGGGPFQRSYIDGTLPDLIKSGRPLSRSRTLGPMSATVG